MAWRPSRSLSADRRQIDQRLLVAAPGAIAEFAQWESSVCQCVTERWKEEDTVNTKESFSYLTCIEQMHIAERELAAFISAVTDLFGREQAMLSAEDWLDEAELMDSPPRSTSRNWRAVTVESSARLANRLPVALHHRTPLVASTDTKVSPIPSSNCFSFTFLVRCVHRGQLFSNRARKDITH